MATGILGKKLGMTHLFVDGKLVPATVIEAGPCPILQVKTVEKDGYSAIQIGFGDKKKSRINKPEAGKAAKNGKAVKQVVREVRLDDGQEVDVEKDLDVNIFADVASVDVVGVSKGRGFSGVVKRWGFGGGRASHGGDWERKPGSIGMCADPGKTIKGKKMPGQYGNKRITMRNLQVLEIDVEKSLIVVKGGVPGPKGGHVFIRSTNKLG